MKRNKTASSLNLHKPQWSIVSALMVVSLLAAISPALAQQPYETPPVLSASKILPPDLLSGPNFRVRESVTNDGYLNTYTIDSPFGTFTAVSTAMLRKRIGEINAMVVMQKVQSSKEYIDSIKEGGLDAMTSAMNLITSPVQTLSGAVQVWAPLFPGLAGACSALSAVNPKTRASKTPSVSRPRNGNMPMSSTSMFIRKMKNFRTC